MSTLSFQFLTRRYFGFVVPVGNLILRRACVVADAAASAAYIERHGIQTALNTSVNHLLAQHPLPADPFPTLVCDFTSHLNCLRTTVSIS